MYLGEQYLPVPDAKSAIYRNKFSEYHNDEIRIVSGIKSAAFIEYKREIIFLFRISDDYSRYKCEYSIPVFQIRALVSNLVEEAVNSERFRWVEYKVLLQNVRDIAFAFGKDERSDYSECDFVYWKSVYEDERIIIEAEVSFEWDTKVYVKLDRGGQTVLDYDYCLRGKWMDYVRRLAAKARIARRKAGRGFIEDEELFN